MVVGQGANLMWNVFNIILQSNSQQFTFKGFEVNFRLTAPTKQGHF